MYSDYDVTYVTSINEFIMPMLIFFGILIIFLIVYLIALAKVFKKANRSGIAAIIPIYNFVVMLEIVNMPVWYIILFFIPVVNFILPLVLYYKIAKSFRKSNAFAILTVLFPGIFIPILAFSDSEYIGINKEAMMGVSYASDKPVVKQEDIEATKPEEVKETKPLDISIGGGVYQKEYQESLLEVPEENKKVDMLASFRVEADNQNKTMPEPEKTGADLLKNVEFIESNETHPSDFNMPTQVDEPKVITTGEIYNSIPNINQNEKKDIDIISIQPIPTVVGPESVVQDVSIPNIGLEQPEVVSSNNVVPNINVEPSITNPIPNNDMMNVEIPNISLEQSEVVTSNNVVPNINVEPTTATIPNNNMMNIEIPNISLEQSEVVVNSNNVESTANINPTTNLVNSIPSNLDESQYVNCSNCGAIIKNDAPRCFMCGKER